MRRVRGGQTRRNEWPSRETTGSARCGFAKDISNGDSESSGALDCGDEANAQWNERFVTSRRIEANGSGSYQNGATSYDQGIADID